VNINQLIEEVIELMTNLSKCPSEYIFCGQYLYLHKMCGIKFSRNSVIFNVTRHMFNLLIDWIRSNNVLMPTSYTIWPKLINTNLCRQYKNLHYPIQLLTNMCSHNYSYLLAFDDHHQEGVGDDSQISYERLLNLIWLLPSPSIGGDTDKHQSQMPSSSTYHTTDTRGFGLSTWFCLHGKFNNKKIKPNFNQLSEMDLLHHVKLNHLQHLLSLDFVSEPVSHNNQFVYQSLVNTTGTSSQFCSTNTDHLSLQIWISSMYSCVYLRIVKASANDAIRTLEHDETGPLKNTTEILLLGDLCLEFSKDDCNIYNEWNHLFMFIQWIDCFNARVSIVINGWFESIGNLLLNDKVLVNATNSSHHQFAFPVLHFGHLADVYSVNSRRSTFDLGNILLFAGLPFISQEISPSSPNYYFKCKKKCSKHHQQQYQHEDYFNNPIKTISLSLCLLGPSFTGYFDSIESGAYYRNSADCILYSFIHRYALKCYSMPKYKEYISQLLMKGHSLIHSEFWLKFLKKFSSEHIFIILLSNNLTSIQFILPKSISLCTVKFNESLPVEVNNDDNESFSSNMTNIQLCNSNTNMNNKSVDSKISMNRTCNSEKRLWILRSKYSTDKNLSLIHSVNCYYQLGFDSILEPYGGIEVPIYLLGEVVCQTHIPTLISCGLKLLFTMLRHSCMMYAKFHSPALSHPGLENPIERRHKKWLFQKCNDELNCKPVPLSFGHCLLARLFKHPLFNTSSMRSYKIMKVLLNEIILTLPLTTLMKQGIQHTSSDYLLINPNLLRCLILFGSQSFWYPSPKQQFKFISCKSTNNHSDSMSKKYILFNYGLIPGIFELLMNYNECLNSTTIIIKLYNLSMLDKWHLIMAALTGFRDCDTFINIFMKDIPQSNDWNLYKLNSNYTVLSTDTMNNNNHRHYHHHHHHSLIASHCFTSIRPPLWLIYCLIRHPYLSQRESALSGYCVWLHFEASKWIRKCEQLSSIPMTSNINYQQHISQSHRIIPSQLSRLRSFATGLLLPTLPFMCISNVNNEINMKNYHNRHLCSIKLVNRAFGLILHGLEKFTLMNHYESVLSQHLKRTFIDTDEINANISFTNYDSNNENDKHTTPEIELCTYGLDALIILLQDSDICVLSAAIKSNLLPVLFNMAWLLEFGMYKANSLLSIIDNSTNVMKCIVPNLMPILTSLSRLIGRVTGWLIMDERFQVGNVSSFSSNLFHYSLDTSSRYQLIITFLRHLIAMKAETINEDYDNNVVENIESELKFDPGPVSRCLVRRVLHSLLENSINQLDRIGRELENSVAVNHANSDGIRTTNAVDEYIKHLCEKLKLHHDYLRWVLNCTVNVLLYSPYQDETIVNIMHKLNLACEVSKRENSTTSTVPVGIPCLQVNFKNAPDDKTLTPITSPASSNQYHLINDLTDKEQDSCDQSKYSLQHDDDDINKPTCHINNEKNFSLYPKHMASIVSIQQSLEQALITSMFTTTQQIQYCLLLKIPIISNCLTTNDFLNLYKKSLGRILISRTQLPENGVAVDLLLTYLLRLFNEESILLNLCLSALPPMYSPTFWSNLISVKYWLHQNIPIWSTHLSSGTLYNTNNSNAIDNTNFGLSSELAHSKESYSLNLFISRQLKQLYTVISALLNNNQITANNPLMLPIELSRSQNLPSVTSSSSSLSSLPPRIHLKFSNVARSELHTYRELIMIADRKAGEQWKLSLPNLNKFIKSKESMKSKKISVDRDKKSILAQLIQMFWPKSTNTKLTTNTERNLFNTNDNLFSSLKFSKSYLPRKFSTVQLCSQARKQCVDGHNAWLDAYSERRRIVGPLGTVLWARVAEHLSHDRGLFHHLESTPSSWCVDPVEDSLRQHCRFHYTHLPITERLIHTTSRSNLSSTHQPHRLASLIGLPIVSRSPPVGAACTWSDLPLCLPLPAIPLIQLASASRYHIQAVWACRLVGVLHIPPIEGDLILGQSWLRFQPDPLINANFLTNNNKDSNSMQFIEIESLYPYQSPSNRLWFAWSFKSIHHIETRRYSLRDIAVEIFPDDTNVNTPMLFAMYSCKDRNNFIETISPLIGHRLCSFPRYLNGYNSEASIEPPSNRQCHHHSIFRHLKNCRLQCVQQAWLNGELSNFDYLMKLNTAAGRSYNDLMQYPIFPWIIRDYESSVLDLTQPTTFRWLDRPIAVQEDDRAEAVAARFNETELLLKTSSTSHSETVTTKSKLSTLNNLNNNTCPPYHYPAHCSNEAIVLHFLVRLPPFTFRHLRFQDNNFDVPDRLFHSVATTWRLATTTVSCVKELVPEFYFQPEMFINRCGLKLGCRQPGDSVDSVELPPWCKNDPRLFTLICRAALESDYVSMNLSHWIDLLFGYKQSGLNAKESLNLYHPYTYFGAIDVDSIDDPVLAQAVEAMINNYGQTPKQLFHRYPHPSRKLSISNQTKSNVTLQFKSKSIETVSHLVTSQKNTELNEVKHSSTLELFSPIHHNEDNVNLLQTETFPVNKNQYSSVRLDNTTPLETVIGLRWGEWAGSPEVNSFELIWKKQLITSIKSSVSTVSQNSIQHSGMRISFTNSYLTGSIWCEINEMKNSTILMRNQFDDSISSSLNSDKLYHSWDGWVDYNVDHEIDKCLLASSSSASSSLLFNSSTEMSPVLSSPSSIIHTDISWYWKILFCESDARLWVSSLPDISNNNNNKDEHSRQYSKPYLIKLKPSLLDSRTLNISMKPLSSMSYHGISTHRYDKNNENEPNDKPIETSTIPATLAAHNNNNEINLQLPCSYNVPLNVEKPYITSIAIAPSSSHSIQLFVGTCLGSIYLRQLPTNLYDISSINGWLPQDYNDVPLRNENKSLQTFNIIKRMKKSQMKHSKHTTNITTHNHHNPIHYNEINVKEAGLWEITGWKQLNGHAGHEITILVINRNNSLLASGDDHGYVCLWDRYRLTLIKTINTNVMHHHQQQQKQPKNGDNRRCHSDSNTHNSSRSNICWLGLYSCSGVWIAARILDFLAEISDPFVDLPLSQTQGNCQHPPVPMAFSTVSEGRGVNCLLLGGPGGRLVWLNSWTLDTVRTYLLPENNENTRITSLCFGPLLNDNHNYQINSKDLGELLCHGLYVANQIGCVYHFGPKYLHQSTIHSNKEDTIHSSISNDLYKHSILTWLDM
ncbi:Lysosomal-trafficking regulator, partial [Schistosoma japonicum]